MDFQQIFGDVTPTITTDECSQTVVWSNVHQPYPFLNYVRRWLSESLYTMAVDRITVRVNRTTLSTEQLAQRLYCIPIITRPDLFEDFSISKKCTEQNSLLFELNVHNTSPTMRNVTAGDLVWVPLGSQKERLCSQGSKGSKGSLDALENALVNTLEMKPEMKVKDQLIVKLHPGQHISFQMFYTRGCGTQDTKWNQVKAYYRPLPSIPSTKIKNPSRDLMDITRFDHSDERYEFTMDIHGGITLEQIEQQLKDRLDCPPIIVNYQTPSYVLPIIPNTIEQTSYLTNDESHEEIVVPVIEGY
jgi:hypothetical protein